MFLSIPSELPSAMRPVRLFVPVALLLFFGSGLPPLAASAAAALRCPTPPEQVSKNVVTETQGKAAALGKLGTVELKNKTEVMVQDLFAKVPNAERVLVVGMLTSMFCQLIDQSNKLSPEEKLDRFSVFTEQMDHLVNPENKPRPVEKKKSGIRKPGDEPTISNAITKPVEPPAESATSRQRDQVSDIKALLAARDRDQQKWTLRQNHLVKLQTVLRADSEMLKHVAGQATKVGRISTLQDSTATDVVELATLFSSDVLTPDLANHYQEYWRDRHQLLQDIHQQDTKFGDIVALVSKPLHLPDHAENQRLVIGRAFLEKCLGKGPGFTLEISKNEYTYGILGNGNSKNSSRLPVPEHLMAMSEAFRSILPDAETIKNCEALTNGAASIAARATKLVGEAKVLAERTVLAGDCEYTRLD